VAYVDSTQRINTSATPDVPVPTGVAADHIVIIVGCVDSTAPVVEQADLPTGFTLLQEGNLTLDGHSYWFAWKRATGADSGSYTFAGAYGSSATFMQMAIAFSGRDTGNPPTFDITINNSANSSPVTASTPSLTALAHDDLLAILIPDVTATGAVNNPAVQGDFETRESLESGFLYMNLATKLDVSAGSTGAVAFTYDLTSGNSGYAAILIRIPAVPTGTVTETTLTSNVVVADEGMKAAYFTRQLDSFTTLFDELVASLVLTGSTINTKVLESFLAVTDGTIATTLRNRLLQDTITISEGSTEQYTTTNIVIEDPIELSDDLLRFAQVYRVSGDTLTVTDAAIVSVSNALIIAAVLTSNLQVTDEVVKSAYFDRVLDSFLRVADDEPMPSLTRFVLLSDALTVDDGAVATYVPDGSSPSPQLFSPLIKVGFDQPRIETGGYAL
jgi:hypothetical protein